MRAGERRKVEGGRDGEKWEEGLSRVLTARTNKHSIGKRGVFFIKIKCKFLNYP